MAFGRFQATAQDAAGNAIPSASIEVRLESTGALVALYSDRAGATPKGNPFSADSDGYFFFHAAGGAYRVKATSGDLQREWRYVAVGLAAEGDSFPVAVPAGEYDDGTTYGMGQFVFHEGSIFISRQNANLGNEPDHTTPGTTDEWMYAGPISLVGIQSSNDTVTDIIALTQAEYDLLSPPQPTTLYIIREEP